MTNYIKPAFMITLCLFVPPLGWLFMYKYSIYDRKTNLILAASCLAFSIYAISAGNNGNLFGNETGFKIRLTPEEFRDKYNAAAQRLAPNLGLKIEEPLGDKSFTHEFAPNLRLIGTVGDAGHVTELKILTEPKNQDESFQTINVLGLLIATLNPELDAEDRGEVLRDLRMLKEVSTEGTYDCTTNRGWVTYSVHADKGNVTFTAVLK